MRKFYWLLGIVAVAGAGIVGWAVTSKAKTNAVSEPIELPGLDDPQALMAAAHAMVKGDSAAPVTIVEFADFQCPYCGTFALEVEPLIEAEYISTGKVRFQYYDFPLVNTHRNAFLAARAGHCAEDQQKFWEYHHILYRNQNRWAGARSPTGRFEDFAVELGLDGDAFKACLESDRHADVVTANMKLGVQLQVDRTPTVMITQGRGITRRVEPTMEAIREAMERTQTGG